MNGRRRRIWLSGASAMAGMALLLAACGGGSDSADTTTTQVTIAGTVGPAQTLAPATTVVQVVKSGATVAVANASRVDGAASRMTKQLKEDGFTMGTPTNSGGSLQRIEKTQIYFTAGDQNAEAVANSLKVVLGGGSIEVTTMPSPAPTESGELEAGVTVLVALGNDAADKTLAQLQGKTTGSSGSSSSGDSGSTDGDSGGTESTDAGGGTESTTGSTADTSGSTTSTTAAT